MTGAEIRTGSNPPKTKIFVGRLPEDADPAELRRLFERFGVVTECDILNRYGFVHMKTEDMAARAISELDNYDFFGSQISVEASTGKKSGRGRGGGGGGPMRGGSRGRGGGGPMRGGMGRAPPPYMRDQRGGGGGGGVGGGGGGGGDFDRRGPGGPPAPPPMRNGYYDNYDRGGASGYDSYYGNRLPPPSMMSARPEMSRQMWNRDPVERRPHPDMMRAPYERRSYPMEMVRSPYADRLPPPTAPFERRSAYDAQPPGPEMYHRRSPPAAGYGLGMGMRAGYDRDPVDPYRRSYPTSVPIERDMPPVRRF